MGFLDSKKRIMDVVITPNGRASLSAGGLSISYATFTDGQTYYDPSSISGSFDDAVDRILLESPPSLPQDTFAVITDDSGKLVPLNAFGTRVTDNGDLFEGGRAVTRLYNTGSFSSAIATVSNLFQQSTLYNTIIASRDPLDDDPSFVITTNTASFQIDNDKPFRPDAQPKSLNSAPSLFFDKRLSNFAQFKYLPPKVIKNGVSNDLGIYQNIKTHDSYTYKDLVSDVLGTDSNPVKQRVDIDVTDTSETNDLVIQLYETNNEGIIKLDAVDFGTVTVPTDLTHPIKRIVFFGKVFVDQTGSPTFVNLFTMVLD